MRGASQFDETHAFTKTMREFERLAAEYSGGALRFDFRLNGELGMEADYVTFLNQGVAVDHTIVSSSNMVSFAPSIPLMDMPFLFRNPAYREQVLSNDVLRPLEAELPEKADSVIIGYSGGATLCPMSPPAIWTNWQASACA